MIITKITNVNINPSNYNWFKNLGYDVSVNNIIQVPVEHLNKGSHTIIRVKCDVCGDEKDIMYKQYLRAYKYGYYSCCSKCSSMKNKITKNEKYGDENYNNRDKSRETCIDKYGVSNPSQNIEIYNKTLLSGLRIKKYKDTDLYYQGTYEKDFLDRYSNLFNIENGLSIKYNHNNKEYVYHSDFFIREINLIVEIKSTYWFNKHKDICESKIKFTKLHYNYILILDKNYDDFDKLTIT